MARTDRRGLGQPSLHRNQFTRIDRACPPLGSGKPFHGFNQPRQPYRLAVCAAPCGKLLAHGRWCSLPACKTWPSLIPTPPTGFRAIMPERKSCRCDLLHKGLRRPALNHQNGSENIANWFGRSYRLCPDRHRRGRRFSRADLSHSDLTAAPVRCAVLDIEYDNTPSGFIRPTAFLTQRPPLGTASSVGVTHFAEFPTPIV